MTNDMNLVYETDRPLSAEQMAQLQTYVATQLASGRPVVLPHGIRAVAASRQLNRIEEKLDKLLQLIDDIANEEAEAQEAEQVKHDLDGNLINNEQRSVNQSLD